MIGAISPYGHVLDRVVVRVDVEEPAGWAALNLYDLKVHVIG